MATVSNGSSKTMAGDGHGNAAQAAPPIHRLHPAWLALIRFCAELRHGEIECLKIQDGLPVLAEVTTKKIKFG